MGVERGKTVTKPLALSLLGLPLSEKQIPQRPKKTAPASPSEGDCHQ
jgi:hypothetical protein